MCRKYGAEVFDRVPAGNLIETALMKGIPGIKKRRLRRMGRARFDHVVCREEGTPVFAVDFGRTGGRAAAGYKRTLSRHSGLPYLQLRSAYLRSRRRQRLMLCWCMELWFEQEEYRYWQKEGILPQDKPLNIFEALSAEPSAAWPVALFQELNDELQKQRGKAGLNELRAEFRIGVDSAGAHRGIATIRAGNGAGLAVRARLRAENIEGLQIDLLKAVLIRHLLHKLRRKGFKGGGDPDECERWFDKRCTALASGVFGWGL